MKPSAHSIFGLVILLTLHFTNAISEKDKEPANKDEILSSFWERLARKKINETYKYYKKPAKPAKNVILFLGDGMGMPTITAARFFKAEMEGRIGAANPLLGFEDWPFHTLCRTFNLYTEVTDSASSATAYLGGTKTITGMLGLTGDVRPKECRLYKEEEMIESVLEAAIRAGKATGLVSTARITHASPAGAYAHIAYRRWESDSNMMTDCQPRPGRPKDIARKLLEDHPDIKVMIGGGSEMFYPKQGKGIRNDGRNLAKEWLQRMQRLGRRAKFVNDSREFVKTRFDDVDYLLGLLAPSHMDFEVDRKPGEASIVNMTTTAIEILSRQPNGFFLFVEGARIDHAHHGNLGKQVKSLIDMLAFEEAIREGVKMVNLEETLVILTADHSHSFHLVGEPSRLSSLLALDESYGPRTLDNKGMIPLLYSSGSAAKVNTTRDNFASPNFNAQLGNSDFKLPAFIPLNSSTHGGEDVGVYATGLFSQLFHSTVDNTFIAQSMKYAMCLTPFETESHCSNESATLKLSALSIILTLLLTRYNHC
nr:alkaline phosphatase [Hymenolepis microstoma]